MTPDKINSACWHCSIAKAVRVGRLTDDQLRYLAPMQAMRAERGELCRRIAKKQVMGLYEQTKQ